MLLDIKALAGVVSIAILTLAFCLALFWVVLYFLGWDRDWVRGDRLDAVGVAAWILGAAGIILLYWSLT